MASVDDMVVKVEVTGLDTRPAAEPILRYFEYAHLPPSLQAASAPFTVLAGHIMSLPRSAERTVALRKLLEAKDAAVRAALPTPGGA